MNAEESGVDNLPRAGGLSYTQQNGDPAESERRSQGTPRTRRTGQQINHNESTLILLPGCPKNGVHLKEAAKSRPQRVQIEVGEQAARTFDIANHHPNGETATAVSENGSR